VVVQGVNDNLLSMAQHKFASNVVEKCLQYGNQQQKTTIIDEVTRPSNTEPAKEGEEPKSTLLIMIKDQYANYVIQKVIDLADRRQLDNIMIELRAHLVQVSQATWDPCKL